MRVHFIHDYDHRDATITISYRAGQELTVTKEIGEAAVKAGKARKVQPAKDQDGE